MKPFLFLLLILPAGLNAQTGVSAPKTQLPAATIEFSTSLASIANVTLKVKDVAATIKSSRDKLNTLQLLRRKIQAEITDLQDQIKNLPNTNSNEDKKAELETKLAMLTEQLNETNKKISELQNFINAQSAEISKLEDSIDQMRRKMEETAARDRQQTESKQLEEVKKTVTIVEEKALAYAHVKIILDSLPPIGSRLSLAERNLVTGFNSRFNNDAEFRTATNAYIKHSKASNYFGVMRKGGSSTDQINRLLIAVKEELVILARN